MTLGTRPLLAGALLLAACGGPPPAERQPVAIAEAAPAAVALDLVRRFPAAQRRREVETLDLGTAAARPHLAAGAPDRGAPDRGAPDRGAPDRGWGADEREADRPFVWGLGEGSELEFYAAGPAAVTLVLHCRALHFDGAPAQRVSVAVNGLDVGTVEVGESPGRYRLELPAAALRRGANRLRFAYAWSRRPRDVLPGSRDERPLAVRFEAVELRGLGSAGEPRLSAAGDRLEIPAGSEVSYTFDFEPGAEVMIGEIAGRGGDGVRLHLEMETAAGETSHLLAPGSAERPLRLPLATETPALGRLTFCATREGAGEGSWLRRVWRRLSGGAAELSLLLPMVMRPAEDREAAAADPLAAAVPAPAAPAPADRPSRTPDVLIYLIDTLRADHLGLYGYRRPTSPEIDRFAEQAVVFDHALAQSSWTRTAVVSLMTGLLPQVHGVNRRDEALGRSAVTLAEILAGAGYRTAGFITNGNVDQTFGLGQGFDGFFYLNESQEEPAFHQLADRLNRRAFPWLEERARAGAERPPYFLYLHATDPHAPYTPPEPFRQRFAPDVDPEIGLIDNVHDISAGRKPAPAGTAGAFIDLYDGEIAWNDHHFGRLLAKLRELGLYDSTLIVLLSDHGEEFDDHGGWEHGKTLYGEQLRIPLVVKLPRGEAAGRRVGEIADQVDLLPTVLDVLGLEPPPGLDGRSLLPLVRGARRQSPSFAYLRLEGKRLKSVVARGWKLIVDDSRQRRRGARELYRLAVDPREQSDLYPVGPLERGFLEQTLRAFELDLHRGERRFEAERAEIDAELRRRLEALGYID